MNRRLSVMVLVLAVVPAWAQGPDIDFNNDGVHDAKDREALELVYSGGECGTCDSVDVNRDGVLYDPADVDAFARAEQGVPPRDLYRIVTPAAEWYAPQWAVVPPLPAGAVEFYVAPDGDDTGPGTEAQPFQSLERAGLAVRARVGWEFQSADRIRLLRGGSWDAPRGFGWCADADPPCSGFGWGMSGKSEAEPFVLYDYGNPAAPPPQVRTTGFSACCSGTSHLWLLNLHLVAKAGDGLDRRGAAIRVFGPSAGGLVFQRLTLEGFSGGFSLESGAADSTQVGVTIRGCWVKNTHASTWNEIQADGTVVVRRTHSSAVFASGNSGLRILWSVFDTNGWVPGSSRHYATIFNHGYYGASSTTDALLAGNILYRSSAAGIQVRANRQSAVGNIDLQSATGIGAGHDEDMRSTRQGGPKWPARAWGGAIAYNVVAEMRDISASLPRGMGIGVSFSRGGQVVGNVVGDDRSEVGGETLLGVTGPNHSLVMANNWAQGSTGRVFGIGVYRAVYGDRNSPMVPAELTPACWITGNTLLQTGRGILADFPTEEPGGSWRGNRWGGTTLANRQVSLWTGTARRWYDPAASQGTTPFLEQAGLAANTADAVEWQEVMAGKEPAAWWRPFSIDFDGNGVYPDDNDTLLALAAVEAGGPASDFDGNGQYKSVGLVQPVDWSMDTYLAGGSAEFVRQAGKQLQAGGELDMKYTARGYREWVGRQLPGTIPVD
jgi:hypothetical protein